MEKRKIWANIINQYPWYFSVKFHSATQSCTFQNCSIYLFWIVSTEYLLLLDSNLTHIPYHFNFFHLPLDPSKSFFFNFSSCTFGDHVSLTPQMQLTIFDVFSVNWCSGHSCTLYNTNVYSKLSTMWPQTPICSVYYWIFSNWSDWKIMDTWWMFAWSMLNSAVSWHSFLNYKVSASLLVNIPIFKDMHHVYYFFWHINILYAALVSPNKCFSGFSSLKISLMPCCNVQLSKEHCCGLFSYRLLVTTKSALLYLGIGYKVNEQMVAQT